MRKYIKNQTVKLTFFSQLFGTNSMQICVSEILTERQRSEPCRIAPSGFFSKQPQKPHSYSSFYYVQKVGLRQSFVIIPIFIILESLQHSNYKKSRTNKHEKTIINIICMDNFYGQYLFTTNE